MELTLIVVEVACTRIKSARHDLIYGLQTFYEQTITALLARRILIRNTCLVFVSYLQEPWEKYPYPG